MKSVIVSIPVKPEESILAKSLNEATFDLIEYTLFTKYYKGTQQANVPLIYAGFIEYFDNYLRIYSLSQSSLQFIQSLFIDDNKGIYFNYTSNKYFYI